MFLGTPARSRCSSREGWSRPSRRTAGSARSTKPPGPRTVAAGTWPATRTPGASAVGEWPTWTGPRGQWSQRGSGSLPQGGACPLSPEHSTICHRAIDVVLVLGDFLELGLDVGGGLDPRLQGEARVALRELRLAPESQHLNRCNTSLVDSAKAKTPVGWNLTKCSPSKTCPA